MLDLFSGTGSVAKVYRDHGYEVITLDSDPRFKADIQTTFWIGMHAVTLRDISRTSSQLHPALSTTSR